LAAWGGPLFQHLIGCDDVHHLVVAGLAERRSHKRKRRLLLRSRQVSEFDAVSFGRAGLQLRSGRQIRPVGAGRVGQFQAGPAALICVESAEKGVGGLNDSGRGIAVRGATLASR
jgi:hypothetical protein